MQRRTFLKGATALGLASGTSTASAVAAAMQGANGDNTQPDTIAAALSRFREIIPANFVAFSQWGNTIFGIMSRLSENGGDTEVREAFHKTMTADYDNASGEAYTPLELFRTISPNGGSISAIQDARTSAYGESPHKRFGLPFERNSYMSTPHTSTSFSPVHWKNPEQFDPERYRSVPTSAQISLLLIEENYFFF